MTRITAREIALQLGFSVVVSEEFAEDVLDGFFDREHYATLSGESRLFDEYPDARQMDYIRRLVKLIFDHRVELNAYIEKYAKGWKVGRISKTAAAVMRCAMCEILYMDDIPNAAAINEAVELAKGYEDEDVVAFINGVLGGFVRGEIGDTAADPYAAAEDSSDEQAAEGGDAGVIEEDSPGEAPAEGADCADSEEAPAGDCAGAGCGETEEE